MARIDAGSVEILSDDVVEARLSEAGDRSGLARGGLDGRRQAKRLIAFARLGNRDEVFPGYSWRELRNGGREKRENGVLCHTAVEIQSAVGCPFDCSYCPYTSFMCVRLDVEDFVDRVAELAQTRPAQSLYKLNNRTDTLGLEPEYGLSRALVERFADLDDRYLMLYSKGSAVDALIDLDHRGKTIASFTLTPEPIAALLETGAPPPSARLVAIGKLARAGYPVRVRLSPVVPVRGWRQAYRDLIERLMKFARPEMVTLWTLSMVNIEDLASVVPAELIDQDVLEQSRAAADQMRGKKGAPFPPDVRADIYRTIAGLVRTASPATQVSLCLETEQVWDAIEPVVVPRCGGDFLCNCGPRVTPTAIAQIVPLGRREIA